MHFFSRPETAGLACFRQASRSRWLSSGLLSGMMAGELGGLPGRQGGRAWTGAGPDLPRGFPPDSGREPGALRSEGASEAPTQRVRSTVLPLAGGLVWTIAGWALRGGFPPGPGRGIQAFSRESPDAKSRGGMPPAPPGLWPARYSLARFGGCAALFRWWGYYGAHLRALIWDAFSGRAAQPRGFPLGGSCHRR